MSILKRSIDAATAGRMIAAAAARSRELGKAMSIAVVDEAGQLKAFHAMDGAAHLTVGIAQDKAWPASSFAPPPHVWGDFVKNDPPLLHGITNTPRLTIF